MVKLKGQTSYPGREEGKKKLLKNVNFAIIAGGFSALNSVPNCPLNFILFFSRRASATLRVEKSLENFFERRGE